MRTSLRLAAAFFATLPAVAALAAPPIAIEPVRANIDRNWLYEVRESRAKAGAPRESEVRAIAADLAKDFQATLERTLRDAGFQIGGPASSGAIRVVASLDDLYVSAPENSSAGVTAFTRQAGRATLRLKAFDASGAVLMSSEQRSEAGDMGRLQRATDVSNRFWFEALFRDWSAEVAMQLKQKAP